jgi:ubiquinone/menaquinone biosynthesis C-methylase UbiE
MNVDLLEEGAALRALEGRRLGKDDHMNQDTNTTNDQEHFAPVEAWDAIAASYDTFVTPREESLAITALRLAGLKAGDRFLDVAAGSGGLAIPAARLGAKVVATDWSPKMIEHFEARVRKERIDDANGKVMGCHRLDLEDGEFDVTGSQFGVMLVPNQAKALREMVRVTKNGGTVLLIAYGPPSQFEVLQTFIGGLKAVLPGFEGIPADPPPLEFQVADPEVMRQRLTAAGLRDVTVHTEHVERVELRSGKDLWDWCLGSNPIPNMLVADLTSEQRAAFLDWLDAAVSARPVLSNAVNIGIGRAPLSATS